MSLPTPQLDRMRFLVTAIRGTERILFDELREHELNPVMTVPGGVVFEGDIAAGLRACLWLRTGQRVLALIGKAVIRNPKQLYEATRALPLEDWFHPSRRIAVQVQGGGELFRDSRYPALVIKDAIVDAMRDRYGARPSVAREMPDVSVVAIAEDVTFRFFIAINGAPLNQRGYRKREVAAPVRESLAAALILASDWDRKAPLWDPMCGSGTIAIEAAWMATDRAPGLGRTFGFEHWHFFERELDNVWDRLVHEAEQRRKPRVRGIIQASDIDGRAVEATRHNLAAADLFDSVTVTQMDALQVKPFRERGWFVTNPPYGDRIGESVAEAAELVRAWSVVVGAFPGHDFALIGSREMLDQAIARRAKKAITTFNGSIPARILVYENKKPKPAESEAPPSDPSAD